MKMGKLSSFSILLHIIVLTTLYFEGFGKPILITCTDTCGCVSETGIHVYCNFLQEKSISVLRGDDKYESLGAFVVVHQVIIKRGIIKSTPSATSSTCENAGGSSAPGGRKICWKTNKPNPEGPPPPTLGGCDCFGS